MEKIGMRCYKATVTPKMAMGWLKKNLRNRPVSRPVVELYADEMKRGVWRLTGDTIKLDKNGCLIDGQHRLEACVKADKPFETYIIEGVEAEAFNVLDQGNRRTLAHALGRERKKHYNVLAGAVRMLWILENGYSEHTAPRLRIDDGFAVLERHPAVEKVCDLAVHWRDAGVSKPPLNLCHVAAFATWTYEKHGDKALTFWEQITAGEGLERGTPQHMLRKRLEAERKAGSTVLHRDVRMGLCIKAFNAFISKKATLSRLSFDMAKEEMPRFA